MIVFRDFTYKYKSQKNPTLKNINLTINDGEKILIVGPSGSGKSTLGNCINGLIPHSIGGQVLSGSVTIDGLDLVSSSIYDINRKVGTVLQDTDCQFVGLTVEEDIAFSLENQNVEKKEMDERVRKAANIVSMGDFLQHSPMNLSGGQKQRISLSGVLVDDVDILLFDEPLANLDPYSGQKTIELIDELHKKTNKTIVIIEHRLEDVLHRDVDRIILVDKGEIVLDTTPNELLHTDTLKENGIREPLYLAALNMAGCDMRDQDLSSIDRIDPESYRKELGAWATENVAQMPEVESHPMLSVKDLSFSYDGRKKVLEDISFSIKQGEMVAILGKNGAGKSTLAKLLMGIEKPDTGKIFINGRDGSGDTITARSMDVGYVMQNPNHMISHNLIYDEVAFGLRQRGVDEATVKKAVTTVLRLCGLERHIKWPISALSYGQKKRITIASILVLQPKVLILDEPTAAQDYKHYKDLMDFLAEINVTLGITILFVTHDMHLALEYTDRAIVFSDGRMLDDNRTSMIFSNEQLLKDANLKQTSLYTLARNAGIENIPAFIDSFIAAERKNSRREIEKFDFEVPDLQIRGFKKKKKQKDDEGSQKIGIGLSYVDAPSYIHRLAGTTKFLFFVLWLIICFTTFDMRILLFAAAISQIALFTCKVPMKRFRPFIILMIGLLTMNSIFIYLFSPAQGTEYMGTQTILLGSAAHRYNLSLETLWYLLIVTVKYLAIFPVALIFITATNPSEFASSLNRLKINYRTSYAVSLTLRYLPELIDDYTHISQSQQCRGVDLSRNTTLKNRIKGLGKVVAPLVLSSLDKIDIITNAMTLRGFAREKTRTWFNVSKMRSADYLVLAGTVILLIITMVMRFGMHIKFWYPF